MKHKNGSLGKDLKIEEITPNIVSIVSARDLIEHNRRRQNHFAIISFETALCTCRWCLKRYHSKYDLGWGSKYSRYAYDSEECKNADARSRGWKEADELSDD